MNLNQDDHIDWDEFVQAMTENNIFLNYLDEDKLLPTSVLQFYSDSPEWAYVIDPSDYAQLDYEEFEQAMIYVKQFEYVASDTIANNGIVDASNLATQVFAENYDYALMEAVDPSADDNVDFLMWVTSISKTMGMRNMVGSIIGEVRAFNQSESMFETDAEFYQCDIN